MKQSKFPPGWDKKRVKAVLDHYETQSEDEATFKTPDQTVMEIPTDLVPEVRELMARHKVA